MTIDPDQCASVWFLRLERARNLGDTDRAREYERRLSELGVIVEFTAAADREEVS